MCTRFSFFHTCGGVKEDGNWAFDFAMDSTVVSEKVSAATGVERKRLRKPTARERARIGKGKTELRLASSNALGQERIRILVKGAAEDSGEVGKE